MNNQPAEWMFAVVEGSPHLFFALDTSQDEFLYLNSAFQSLLKNAGVKETLAEILKLVHPEDQEHVRNQYQEWRAGQYKKNVEFRIQLPHKPLGWWCITPFLYKGNDGHTICCGYAEDISVLKEHLEVLRKYANKKNAVLNILSHDLAGPLGSINNVANLLSRHTKRYDDATINNFLSMIGNLSKRSITLIQNFVQQEFLESTATQLIKNRVNLAQKIQDIVDEYHKSESDLLPQLTFASSASSIYVQIDEPKFMQVITNLLSNALKFTPDNGRIHIELTEQPSSILFTIADTGIGIPEKFHSTLFEKFSLARRPGLKGEPTVGLGMSIIKTIVEWHNGKIWFKSTENKGTTFFVELPV